MSSSHGSVKGSYQVEKSWLQRKKGVMKKADEVHKKFAARVALVIEREGVLYAYLSQDDFLNTLPSRLSTAVRSGPNDFITVAEQMRSRGEHASLPAPPNTALPPLYRERDVLSQNQLRRQERTLFEITRN